MTDANGIKRAAAGGEIGVNGDFYEGGKFMPSQEDRPKTAPVAISLSPEEVARRAAWKADAEARAARLEAWLTERRTRFAPVIATLLTNNLDCTEERWAWLLANGNAGFHASLGQQLQVSGSLSEKQARYAVKAVLGRETKKNSADWWALFEGLVEDFNPA